MPAEKSVSKYGIPWKHVLSSFEHGFYLRCYVFEGCVMLLQGTNNRIVRRHFLAPDGKGFVYESRLLNYMGLKVEEKEEEIDSIEVE